MTTLDLSRNPDLRSLALGYTHISSLDLSGCDHLQSLFLEQNQFHSLNPGLHPFVESVVIHGEPMTWLDLSCFPALNELECLYCDDITLDVSSCLNLTDEKINVDKGVTIIPALPTTPEESVTPEEPTTPEEPEISEGRTDPALSLAIFEDINAKRAENGAAPLLYCDALQDAANLRAKECAESFSHTRPDGSACFTAFTVSFSEAGENIAMCGSLSASKEVFMEMWMNSEGHRANILGEQFTAVAVGVYVDSASGSTYAVQLFVG